LKKTGLFYGSSSGKTASAAVRIRQALGSQDVDLIDVAYARAEEILNYKYLVMGIPTWGIGELQDDWIDFLESIRSYDCSDKKVALFGLGDQESYPDTFADALGKLYDFLIDNKFRIIGQWPAGEYSFMESYAFRNKQFVGLVLDEENQSHLSEERIIAWVQQIAPELE